MLKLATYGLIYLRMALAEIGETGGNCNIFHIHAHYVEHVFY